MSTNTKLNDTGYTTKNEQSEAKAAEILKIFDNTTLGQIPFSEHDAIVKVYERMQVYGGNFALLAVFYMGYIYGKRADRERKKKAKEQHSI